MNKKAFTLIELLAVIVILALIALIAVPIIINIIRDTKEKSREISKELYLNAVEQTILKENIEGSLNPSSCKVNIDGNIVCDDKEIKIEVNGEKPCTGDIKLNKGMVVDSRLGYCKNNKEYKDNSGANTPELSGLTPVLYKDNSWVIADISEEWYDYEKYNWANAVILTDSGKKKQEGEKLNLEKDVKAMFVWIPRYEYKMGEKEQEISVNFVSGKSITPSSNEYYVHPAFTFGEDELTGIWVGKFETSTDKNSACYKSESVDNCNNTEQDPYILPNVSSLRYQQAVNEFETAKKFNNYITVADSHMMKNREWGVVAYLSQSKYGKYGKDQEEVYINNCSNHITGVAGDTASAGLTTSTCTTNTYETEKGQKASTTGTIYGIYDMSGGSWEYVMGVLADSNGRPRSGNSVYNSGFNGSLDSGEKTDGNPFPDSKYYDKYTVTSASSCTDAECKGHALNETAEWYGDYASFVSSSYPWFRRGGAYDNGASASVFAFYDDDGGSSGVISFRVVVAPLN